ncbi:hypothetical protein FB451DRAFT_40666 [Mycena latifolia]|nr:hypothetical protein FB451DRAFT_40666 [Mycena latifolia]
MAKRGVSTELGSSRCSGRARRTGAQLGASHPHNVQTPHLLDYYQISSAGMCAHCFGQCWRRLEVVAALFSISVVTYIPKMRIRRQDPGKDEGRAASQFRARAVGLQGSSTRYYKPGRPTSVLRLCLGRYHIPLPRAWQRSDCEANSRLLADSQLRNTN